MGVWDFDGFSTSEYTHDMHTYPARLNPRVARRLIDEYGSEGDFLLDPFCGSYKHFLDTLTLQLQKFILIL